MNLEWFKPDTARTKKRTKVGYNVNSRKLFYYERHEKGTGNLYIGDKIIGNTKRGDFILGLSNINKIVF